MIAISITMKIWWYSLELVTSKLCKDGETLKLEVSSAWSAFF